MNTGSAVKLSGAKTVPTGVAFLVLLVVVASLSGIGSVAFASDYQITASAGKGGQVSPAVRDVFQGSSASFTVDPEPGYRILDSLVGGNCARGSWNGNIYTTGAITQDCSVSFRFFSSSYLVTATVAEGGHVDPDTRVVTSGTAASFNVIPEAGHIIGTAVGGSCATGSWSGNIYTTGPVNDNCSVSFSFPALHKVTVSAEGSGSVSPSTQVVVHGSGTSFAVTPTSGFSPDTSVGGSCPEGSWNRQVYTTGPVTRDCFVVIEFMALRSIMATAGSGGRVAPNSREVAVGTRANFRLDSAPGFVPDDKVGGTCPAGTWEGDTYATGRVGEDCSVVFAFIPIVSEATVNAMAGSGGSVSAPVQVVNRGESAGFSVNADIDYSVNRSVGGTCSAGSWSGDRYTTGDIHDDCTVLFSFSFSGHNVSAVAAGGGSVEPQRRTVADGATAGFKVSPAPGYTVASVVGGNCLSGGWSDNNYTTGPIRENCSVRFSFSAIAHKVTAITGFGGSVTSTTRNIANGATASFTVVPDFGYARSTGVGGDCVEGSWIGNTYSTGPVNQSCSVEFDFHYIH